MKRRHGTLLLLAAFLVWTGTLPAEPLAPFRAVYELRVNGVRVGERTLELTRASDHYRLVARTVPRGLGNLFHTGGLLESSLFRLRGDRLQPLEYRYRREGRRAHLHFDWSARRVTNDIDGNRWQMEITEDTVDKLLVQLAIARELARGVRGEIRYPVADGGRLKTFRFLPGGEETVETPAGRFRALILKRLRHDRDRSTRLWCAPRLDYLPVRIEQEEHEDRLRYESLLSEYRRGASSEP